MPLISIDATQLEQELRRLYQHEAKLRTRADAKLRERLEHLEDDIERLEQRLAEGARQRSYSPEVVTVEDAVRAAIDSEFVLRFWYQDGDGNDSYRTVSPYTLAEAGNGVELLTGWDHDRDAIRHYRAERIDAQSLAPSQEAYRFPEAL